eukprot:Ihof_evm1s547 gene=Ihof_evmTU1s547
MDPRSAWNAFAAPTDDRRMQSDDRREGEAPRGERYDRRGGYRREERRNGDAYDNRNDRRGGSRYETRPDGPREVGIVDKLTDSYGFIECVEKQQRIFFHFSHYRDDASQLQPGDGLEFTVGSDNRTGKLVAYDVVLLPPGTVSFEIIDDHRTRGEISYEVYGRGANYGKQGGEPGKIRFKNANDQSNLIATFTAREQTDPECALRKGDIVECTIVTHKRHGLKRAIDVTLVERVQPPLIYATIVSLKDKFGFLKPISKNLELSDVFFHYMEYEGDPNNLEIGQEVSYIERKRQRDMIASCVKVLAPGALDEVDSTSLDGVVSKGLSQPQGRTSYYREAPQGQIEIREGEGESLGSFVFDPTNVKAWGEPIGEPGRNLLGVGDKVKFNVATHKILGTKRAINIELVERAPLKKEYGHICFLRDGNGHIERIDRMTCIPFDTTSSIHASVENKDLLSVGCAVEYSVQKIRRYLTAFNVMPLAEGVIPSEYETTDDVLYGILEKPYTVIGDQCGGSVKYEVDSQTYSYPFSITAIDPASRPIKIGETISFRMAARDGGKKKRANDVRPLYDPTTSDAAKQRGKVVNMEGTVGTVKVFSPTGDMNQSMTFCVHEIQPNTRIGINDDVEFFVLTNKITGEPNAC